MANLALCLLVIALFSCDSNSEKETKTEEYTEPISEKLNGKRTKEDIAKQMARLTKVPLPLIGDCESEFPDFEKDSIYNVVNNLPNYRQF
jgi:hypothetical protein